MTKILLADDERDIAFLTKILLENEGHQVEVANNGEECLRMLRTNKPDIILLDIMMPGENGWEICRKIKKDKNTKDIPVVMFTVRSSEDSIKKSLEYACADTHFSKPFEKEELLKVVNNF